MIYDFIRARAIPDELADKIEKFYAYVMTHEFHEYETTLMAGLSSSLRTEVVLYLYKVSRVPSLSLVPYRKSVLRWTPQPDTCCAARSM